LAFSDGYTIQDHKRIGERDTGLNTRGMGTYAPAPVATPEILEQIMKECLRPTIEGMRKEGVHINAQSPSCGRVPMFCVRRNSVVLSNRDGFSLEMGIANYCGNLDAQVYNYCFECKMQKS
jgi:hypothetical protein